ncbi:hypothetical protein MP638_002258 [Amoeboaphelidium occidentale]|nr:hypothetical protein MP638_002258 [Amoeboaphelidium occidentale]
MDQTQQFQYCAAKLEAVETEIKEINKEILDLDSKERPSKGEKRRLALLKSQLAKLEKKEEEWSSRLTFAQKLNPDVEEHTFRGVDNRVIASITGVNTVRKLWQDVALDESVFPTEGFKDQYDKNCRVWSMNSEASRRTFIDLILRDVVAREEFAGKLRIFCELSMTVESVSGNKKRKLSGKHDYTIGHAAGEDINSFSPPKESHIIAVEAKKAWDEDDVWQCIAEAAALKLSGKHDYTIGHAAGEDINSFSPPKESHIIAVEAKKAWDEDDVWQCIAEAAALFRTRKDAKKQNCNVWGICSNASNWKFIYIDNGGQVWASDEFALGIPMVRDEKILVVYRFVHFIVTQCYLCSTQTTPVQSPESLLE